jgi:YidC/Oxa1 family membrane protein insertase
MNKQEISVVVALFAILIGWGIFNRQHLSPPPPTAATAGVEAMATNAPAAGTAVLSDVSAPSGKLELPALPEAVEAPAASRQVLILSNAWNRVEVASRGAALRSVELPGYPATLDRNSGPVHLDFATSPALALSGIPGMDVVSEFEVVAVSDSRAVLRARAESGLELERTIQLLDQYQIQVTDRFRNTAAEAVSLPASTVRVGPMHMNEGESIMTGMVYLGLDTLAAEGGARVVNWGKDLNKLFGVGGGFMGCARPNMQNVPAMATQDVETPTDWVAAKNKFFVQILAPDEPADGCRLRVMRDMEDKGLLVSEVAADLAFKSETIAPGSDVTRSAHYYVGPKKYVILKELGKYRQDIMQFGWWDWFRWLCSKLLWTLNTIHSVIPNYGVAVILVTVLVRLIFWPITNKSNESMKKMQRIQPLVTQIRERHKDNPQKMNQEIMLLYREHKVNPMSGCLPMLVQIPVFIALFTMLRSAIELRFASFLWIRDLSEPEGLFASVLPFGGLNILPLLMTATTVLQQKLTPMTGDPQQQKIMMWMPVMFLFMFYGMPSALVLYWTVSQGLAILQLVWSRRGVQPAPLPVPVAASSSPRRGSGPKGKRR